ncbi:hypothetical protein M378DRAFT_163616 [Amanita muscaria Koide BX008]|uniref:Uncharacterized protein n=1 Tax=Amanita muscaria (strain Koide BX008) TaxID=946122 RepID=A0A0C2SLT4_AMAMK|nr:hypothetical protein M378DRAFT_163616 [Amanita muscaria Koide BX008]
MAHSIDTPLFLSFFLSALSDSKIKQWTSPEGPRNQGCGPCSEGSWIGRSGEKAVIQ